MKLGFQSDLLKFHQKNIYFPFCEKWCCLPLLHSAWAHNTNVCPVALQQGRLT